MNNALWKDDGYNWISIERSSEIKIRKQVIK